MAWQQLKEPNLDPIIKQGGHTITDWLGWCLAYTQTAFGAGWAGPNAWDGWLNHTVNKHEDSNLPGDVYVPIWFSGYGGLGHSAIYKNGQVWSSPISHKPNPDCFGSIAEVERNYGVTYVGWSEGLGGTAVVQQVADQPQYTITPIEPKQMRVVGNHYKWNLAQPNFDTVVANPIEATEPGHVFTAVATLTRPDFGNYTYLLDDANTPHGWNDRDCQEVVVAPAMPAPYVPPAAPLEAPAPETYELLTTVMWFSTGLDASLHKDAKGTLAPGKKYYVHGWNSKAVNLSEYNQQNLQQWVNTDDNVVEAPKAVEVPAEDMSWMQVTYWPDTKSRRYQVKNSMTILDFTGRDTQGIDVKVGEWLPIWGYFTKGGITHLMPIKNDQFGNRINDRRYGVPCTSVYTGLPNMRGEAYQEALRTAETENREYRRSQHHETTDDKLYYVQQTIAHAVARGVRFINDVIDLKKLKVVMKDDQKENK